MSEDNAVVKCTSCGADMVFNPDRGQLCCMFCGSTRDIDRRLPVLRNFREEHADGEVPEGSVLFDCPNCGASIEMPSFKTALKCPFCGGTNIVKRENMRGLRPDSILPFGISRDKAAEIAKKWLKKKFFAPGKLKNDFKADSWEGVYIPLFSFNSNTLSSYEGKFGEYRTRIVGSGKNRHVQTYTEWYRVSGNIDKNFSDVLIESSSDINQKELDNILPFDVGNFEAYNREYIAGFTAERYDASLDSSFEAAKNKMNEDIKRDILAKYHPDEVASLNINTNFNAVKFRYATAPLWICAYKFKQKAMRFLINGRTGKAYGKIPVSAVKVCSIATIVAGVLAFLVWLIAFSGLIS